MDLTPLLAAFAAEVGGPDAGAVVCAGGRTQWTVGGTGEPGAREVRAPSGVVEYEPAEMVVRVGAGTTVAELDAVVRGGGQQVVLDPATPAQATVGGVLAVGRSGVRRLRYGPVRDTVLEVRVVLAGGELVKAGGPVVKNVSGYDLGRLLVGSLGTIGFLGEVVLRCSPRPAVATWWHSEDADPFETRDRLFRPSSILWDGRSTWVLLEGGAADVRAERAALGAGWAEVGAPPPVPDGGRRSLRPSQLRTLDLAPGSFVAEIGVGIVHVADPADVAPSALDPSTVELHRRVKAAFDPTGRMNPGRMVA